MTARRDLFSPVRVFPAYSNAAKAAGSGGGPCLADVVTGLLCPAICGTSGKGLVAESVDSRSLYDEGD
jgi:hypothetical protein